MNIQQVYENAMNLEAGSIYELYANRNIDLRINDPLHASGYPDACLIGADENFGVMLSQAKFESVENTEFKMWHELGHYENEHDEAYGKNYISSRDGNDITERYATAFACFRLIPKVPIDNRSIFHVAKEKGIPANDLKLVLFQLSLERKRFFRHYYAAYKHVYE